MENLIKDNFTVPAWPEPRIKFHLEETEMLASPVLSTFRLTKREFFLVFRLLIKDYVISSNKASDLNSGRTSK